MPHELLLVSPYTPPTQHALMLGENDCACWLNAWTALWHPDALRGASAPPRWVGPYDQDSPKAGQLYALPDSPPLHLASDWDDQVVAAGAASFRAVADRAETLRHLQSAIKQLHEPFEFAGDSAPFFGLGLGYFAIEVLFEAMEHERTLDRDGFWADVQAAVNGNAEALTAAAQKLVSARETVYPAAIHLLDFALLNESAALPASFARRSALNLIASGRVLEARADIAELRERFTSAIDPDAAVSPALELCGGLYNERADDLLPVESQLWNLRRGREVAKSLLGADVQVYAPQVSSFHAQSPQILQRAGLTKCLLVAFDDAKLPSHRTCVIHWPASDGRQVEAFCRTPFATDDSQTFFHLGHYLHQTIMQDGAATLALVHRDRPAFGWYDDFLALSQLAPVLGNWTTISHYLRDATVGEYATAATPDDFAIDHLDRLVTGKHQRPVSEFARHLRLRRRVDAAWTCAAIMRSLGATIDTERIAKLEDRIERGDELQAGEVTEGEQAALRPLVERLQSRAADGQKGLMLFNPCGFARRVALERDDFDGLPAIEGPVRAAQRDEGTTRLVVDVPALGFAWVARSSRETQASGGRKPLVLADKTGVRNEHFEAEIDPATGGLRAFRDLKTRDNRVGQQLVYQPGSVMHCKAVNVTATGPAMGEIVTEGALLDEQQKVQATFRQRYRAWLGRPLLEMSIELFPERELEGYPWHAYFGARFAWRDERATLLRSSGGFGSLTTHARPVTPDFLELRSGRLKTQILPQGLPFHQRHGGRMLDVILLPSGETARSFSIALALDREFPAQTAWGLASPILAMPVDRGPPHIGPSGWLAHLDSPNLLLTSLRPDGDQPAVLARLLEVGGVAGAATLRFARNPTMAEILEPDGTTMMPLTVEEDAVHLDYGAHDLMTVRVEF